jgi:hypothetical protein
MNYIKYYVAIIDKEREEREENGVGEEPERSCVEWRYSRYESPPIGGYRGSVLHRRVCE